MADPRGDPRRGRRVLARAPPSVLGVRELSAGAGSPCPTIVDSPLHYKQPLSALVVVHTRELDVLVLERADFPGHWQSVTGSAEPGEDLATTAARELDEETGIDANMQGGVRAWNVANRYAIFTRWRHRYPPGTTHNVERVFSVEVAARPPVRLAAREHLGHAWLPWREAAARCFSWSNRDAILMLTHRPWELRR